MNDKELRLIVELWENGEPISKIIKMLPYQESIAREMVVCLRKQGVLKLENRSNKAGGWRIIEMYKNGEHNPYEIADKLNYSIYTVQSVLSRSKLNRVRPSKNYKKRREIGYQEISDSSKEIVDLLAKGVSCAEIGRTVGCSRQNVFLLKKKFFPEKCKKINKKKGE